MQLDYNKFFHLINAISAIHDGQKRAGSDWPFISHPVNVFLILLQHQADDDTLKAGLAHDYFRHDLKRPYNDLVLLVGENAAAIVSELGSYFNRETGKIVDWKERKYAALSCFSTMSYKAQMVFVADKIHNLASLLYDYRNHQSRVWEKFGTPESEMAEYYRNLDIQFTANFRHPMIADYYNLYKNARQTFNWED